MLTGLPPFSGPLREDYARQHQEELPPQLPECSPHLKTLVTLMLRKTAESRPSLERVQALLQEALKVPQPRSSGLTALAAAGATIAESETAVENEVLRAKLTAERKRKLANEAKESFIGIVEQFCAMVANLAPTALQIEGRDDLLRTIRLGTATLEFRWSPALFGEELCFEETAWDVITGAVVKLHQGEPGYLWSSSLWFAQIGSDPGYRWYEASYFQFMGRGDHAPCALSHPNEWKDAAYAVGPGIHSFQLAWGPTPIDAEDSESFIDRWTALLAAASQGKLRHPSNLPLPKEFWIKN